MFESKRNADAPNEEKESDAGEVAPTGKPERPSAAGESSNDEELRRRELLDGPPLEFGTHVLKAADVEVEEVAIADSFSRQYGDEPEPHIIRSWN